LKTARIIPAVFFSANFQRSPQDDIVVKKIFLVNKPLCYNIPMLHEVVIIGGGFGGVRVAKRLAGESGFHVTLIDKSRYHTFHPNLYEVAASHLPEVFGHLPLDFVELKSSAIYPLEDIFLEDLNVTFLEDEVLGANFKKKELALKKSGRKIYDFLVIAAGSETNYFGIQSMEARALPLKNFFNALSIRNEIDETFFKLAKNHIIKIVIGGGGFSGCELAGELIGYTKKLAKIHGHPEYYIECIIVEGSDKLLGGASEWAQKKAKERLASLGVKFKFNSLIKEAEDGEVLLEDGSKIPYDVLIWTAGVKANNLTRAFSGIKLEKAFCMIVDKYLRVSPHENVFSVGDITYCIDESTGKALPMAAPVALRGGDLVAKNIINLFTKKPLRKYKPSHPGFIVPLGGKYALMELYGFKFAGFLPWVLRELLSLHYWAGLLGWRRAWGIWKQALEVFSRND